MNIPFHRNFHGKNEGKLIEFALASGLASGRFTGELGDFFREKLRISNPLFTPSCTLALELAVRLLGLSPTDEVITPSYNFPSAGNAVLLAGARLVLCDIDPKTGNICPKDFENRITARTKAVIAVHYGGVAADMGKILDIAARYNIKVIEDSAQGIGATYEGAPLGTLGDFGAISFHHTKNIACGEGGALICKNNEDFKNAEILSDCGTDRPRFLRGEVDEYSWKATGTNGVLSQLSAALLLSQLEELERITSRRLAICEDYTRGLLGLESTGAIRLMQIPDYAGANGHMYYVLAENIASRQRLSAELTKKGISAKTHFYPLHLSQMGTSLGYKKGDFRASEGFFERLLRLPIHSELCETEVAYIINSVRECFT